MKPIFHIALIVTFCAFVSNATAQVSASRITKRVKQTNAAQNDTLNQALNGPTSAPPPVAIPPTAAAPTPKAAPVVVPQKTPEQKAKILQKTIEFQKKQAEEGAPTAQYDLGMRYLKGDGVEKDPELAKKWLSFSAKNGNIEAAKKLDELNKK